MGILTALAKVQNRFEEREEKARTENVGELSKTPYVTVATSNTSMHVGYTSKDFHVTVVATTTAEAASSGVIRIRFGHKQEPDLSYCKRYDNITEIDYRNDIERPLRALMDLYAINFE